MKRRISRWCERMWPPSPHAWLVLSALFFLIGAASFGASGARALAELGVVGAATAVAVIVAFTG